jgi:hypothetical protein
MIFDFKTNRIAGILGLLGLFIVVFILTVEVQLNPLWIFAITFLYVYLLAKYMKYVATMGYRNIHQRLFAYGDAKGYLEAVSKLYKGIKKGTDFEGIKLQNLIMAYIFSGDFDSAKKYHEVFVETFDQNLDKHESVRFSRGMIEALLTMFEYDEAAFLENYNNITTILDSLKQETIDHVKNNPYSIYYMMTQIKHLVIDEDTITLDKVKDFIGDDEENEFLKTSILYMLTKNGFLDADDVTEFSRTPMNTMFYLDENRIY